MEGPVALIVLDGWGLRDETTGNAVRLARTPVMDALTATHPFTTLRADGEAVGLLPGQMGNSNVGHLNLGAGRVVYQDLTRIHRALADGGFERNPVIVAALAAARPDGAGGRVPTLHLLGLLSDGGVHSHIDHALALVDLAARVGVRRLALHAFLDGRDVPPTSAGPFLEAAERRLREAGLGRVATVSGRYYAMDRDRRWDRTEKAYRAIAEGVGPRAPSAMAALEAAYARGETDEFVTPTVVVPDGGEPLRVEPGDSLFFFNFRADRARQLTWAFVQEDFAGFARRRLPVHFATMTRYDETLDVPVAFPPQDLRRTMGEVVSEAGLTQLRIAETEKYAHVTYFFNGGREEVFPGEERILVPSPRVATYDLQPEMSAPEVTERLLERLGAAGGPPRFVVLNYANPDMVGHTGVLEAAIAAVETVDRCLGRVIEALLSLRGAALVLADHGNAETMIDPETGGPHTAHTLNPVPCVLVAADGVRRRLRPGILADAAPTLLELLGLPAPPEMTGRSLVVSASPTGATPPAAEVRKEPYA
ncbi:MAG: 2,3-bisphosphoglycerate-independent phosphoglycerate mutase [Clostridia bacterium]|nr:2,3-bisphosphoglycerate-independent phosphoglycerate mutase [Clostridia bacterium]